MCTAPPLAVDRLIGLAHASKNLVARMEDGKLPIRMNTADLDAELSKLCRIISRLLDRDIFPWLDGPKDPTDHERDRASTIVADRLCSAVAKDTVRSARKIHQLSVLRVYLNSRGYREIVSPCRRRHSKNWPGTYAFFMSVPAALGKNALLPIDALVQPIKPRVDVLRIFIQTESWSNFAESIRHTSSQRNTAWALRMTYGEDVPFALMLGGYVAAGYLGTQAAEGIDWVWQHRLADLQVLGL
ncbi:MAG: XamI family restriction endonuclease [Candidatus Anammoximicrobium sp.]|nr:XamI family restriction endonuclease [Candidatus Anammoximicrobium sp.]